MFFFFNVVGFLRSIKPEIEWTRKTDSSRNLENRKAFERACFRVLSFPFFLAFLAMDGYAHRKI